MPELDALGLTVYAVTFESPTRVAAYLEREPLPFPLLLDPVRQAYRAFGMERKSAWAVWDVRTLWYYATRLARGQRPAMSWSADPYQLGGNVLLQEGGHGGWLYRSTHPADRPDVRSIVQRVARPGRVAREE